MAKNNELSNKLERLLNTFESNKNNLANKIGKVCLDFFLDEFDNQRWHESNTHTIEKWKDLSPATLKIRKNKGYEGKPILVNEGDLRSALFNSLDKSTWKDGIKFNVDIEYASYHNDGEGRLPKRQFIGESYELDRVVEEAVIKELEKLFK